MANPKGFNVTSVVRKLMPVSENQVSMYGKVDILKNGSFSVATQSASGERTVYSFPPPSKDYLSTRRLSHNRISAIGSSTVAIDNKIEQAMDLVKSHLMFAVREEVEVLKEQIAELIERNNQLEYENGILRAAASPETLAKLSQPRQPLPSSSS